MPQPHSDVVVVGAGLIGLASAAALALRGATVLLVADVRRGEASPAAAGMLAPTVEHEGGSPLAFGLAARERYPSYVAWLAAETGIDVPLNRLGALQLALTDDEAESLRAPVDQSGVRWMDRAELAALEPTLSHAQGARFHPLDGAVNNLVLMRALKAYVARNPRVTVISDAVVSLDFGREGGVTAAGASESRYKASQVVLAAGAWAPYVDGLPRPLPIEPVRGQMLSVAFREVRHVVYGGGGYIVPRADGRTLIGSTMERVAFDAGTTDAGLSRVRHTGATICPPLSSAAMLNVWAGLRPVTPDLAPVLGRDPDRPALVYACGHSRNGVLLAPLTGDCVASLAAGEDPGYDLAPFSVTRFDGLINSAP